MFKRRDPITIFDIGACEGEDSIRYARLFPKASIFAFEPMPVNIDRMRPLLRKYRVDGQVRPFNVALSDSSGVSQFHPSFGHPEGIEETPDWDYGNKSGSLLAPGSVTEHHPWLKFGDAIDVETVRLDAFCKTNGVLAIDFVHIDVQGAELAVLRGAGAMLAKIRAIWMEVEAVPLYKGQPLAGEVEAFMLGNGFTKYRDDLAGISGDQLYVRQ